VDDRIGHLIANSTNPTVGVLAHPGQVDIRITVKASSEEEASRLIAPVEEEVRGLLGRHVFAADEETMEDVVGKLLEKRSTTIAVYEDITGGMVAERLLQASVQQFREGVIGNGPASIRRLMDASQLLPGPGKPQETPEALTNGLAQAVRAITKSDIGLAVHGVPDPRDTAENLASGRTFLAVTDGEGSRTRTYNTAGRGRPDRTRTSLNALELVRLSLEKGME
jgi:nicotinamide-nucleotide amidase